MIYHKNFEWDANYDVVVLGFGGAGATAARFAADHDAKVLLVDSAPEGHEGGNTRYSAQLIGSGDDFNEMKKYYQKLTAPMELDEDMIDTYVDGMVHIPEYVSKYLGVKPNSAKEYATDKSITIIEYPEFPGSESYDLTSVTKHWFDAALWQILKKQVVKRQDKIDVLYGTPAEELVQDPESKKICGVVIKRDGKLLKVQAKNGVVLTTGGFENNQRMIEDFIGAKKLAPLGSLYNKGDGLRMAQEVGADFWHLHNYESVGLLHGMAFAVPKGQRGRLMLGAQNEAVSNGSVFVIGDDGTRYFNEIEENRHGHIKNHGQWKVPLNQEHPYLIFDETKKHELDNDKIIGDYKPYTENVIKADSVSELADKIGVEPAVLSDTLNRFNKACQEQDDPEFRRDPATLRAFDGNTIYAVKLEQTMLNTQGGPRRNKNAEILDTRGKAIPNLYSAGELGGICANQYQGGNNLAECLIWGKIAGENAAKPKVDEATDAASGATMHEKHLTSDLKHETYETGENQYIGKSTKGMGDEIVVRVTVDEQKNLKNIEVLKQAESDDYGLKAIKTLPAKMVQEDTVDVDAVSGASSSSRGLKDAVRDALSKIK
ncbi:FAD-binding protein [Lactobacillus sp. M0398]|uniref:FAD-binding protein n=1 Tax=unclassified Lactobacillus TaxID=2620435 RepID=UPI0018DBAD3C|nr:MULTISPECIES: FAD-binding protein [unclassified Lactobacillus]MBI0120725.1 FAD-binding protein [Lactobacillus sp. M0398]MBI0122807.1 FAD-binding protein [Lactobacillus sp. W8174]MBI0135042.1 FAD-binding protein [Lactobacillus sp. W8173]